MWVIAGTTDGTTCLNDVWHSTDGASWTEAVANAAFPVRQIHTSVVYNNKMWVIAGENSVSPYILNDVWWAQ
jgi:hypothetical protein